MILERAVAVTVGGTRVNFQNSSSTFSISFAWQKNGQEMGNFETSGGNYNVVVTNSVSSVLSNQPAPVITSGQLSRLPNFSVRTNLPSAQTLIVGFATTGTKTMLVRGIGPTLAVFGLSGVLPDPVIELYSAAAVKIDENNDWDATLSPVFGNVGAFALVAGSKDAALQRACTGSYTAQISGIGGSTGEAIVEVYEVP